MGGDLLITAAGGIGIALLAFELAAAVATLLTTDASRQTRFGQLPLRAEPLWLARPRLIRSHFVAHGRHVAAVRSRWQALRSPSYGRRLRAAIRRQTPGRVRLERSHARP